MSTAAIRDQIDVFYGSPLSVLSDCLRGFLKAKDGFEFLGGDWSSVESRGLNWLAGEETVLQIYRTHGKIYEYNASQIYGIPIESITKDSNERQIGKVAELALGYQGGERAFQAMAKTYGVKVPDSQAKRIKEAWRESHPNVVGFWYALERAAIAAVKNAGQAYTAGARGREITYEKKGSFLWCRLPSGRVICYPYPRIELHMPPWGGNEVEKFVYKAVESMSGKWVEHIAYGGLFAENVTQAVCRDLLTEAMIRAEAAGFPVVLHVHDEIVSEVPKGLREIAELEDLMKVPPAWAKGFPIEAKGWKGPRYRKG